MTQQIDGINFREDPARYGTMLPDDVAYLRNEIIGKWPERDRKLLGSKGLTVVLGDQAWTASVGPNEIYMSKSELDAHRQFPNADFSHALRFKAYIAALGNGPASIDWNAAREEILRPIRMSITPGVHQEMQEGNLRNIERSLSGPNAAAFTLLHAESRFQGRELRGFRQSCPALVDAYEKYLRFVAEQMADIDQQPQINTPTGFEVAETIKSGLIYYLTSTSEEKPTHPGPYSGPQTPEAVKRHLGQLTIFSIYTEVMDGNKQQDSFDLAPGHTVSYIREKDKVTVKITDPQKPEQTIVVPTKQAQAEVPSILINAAEYGTVEQKDIDRFKEIYARWPQKYRELLEAKDCLFVLGSKRSHMMDKIMQLAQETGRSVSYVHVDSMYVPGMAHHHAKHAVNSSDMEFNRKRLMYAALVAVYGYGPDEAELQRLAKKLPDKETQTPDMVLVWASLHRGTRNARNLPGAVEALDNYHAYLDREYELQTSSITVDGGGAEPSLSIQIEGGSSAAKQRFKKIFEEEIDQETRNLIARLQPHFVISENRQRATPQIGENKITISQQSVLDADAKENLPMHIIGATLAQKVQVIDPQYVKHGKTSLFLAAREELGRPMRKSDTSAPFEATEYAPYVDKLESLIGLGYKANKSRSINGRTWQELYQYYRKAAQEQVQRGTEVPPEGHPPILIDESKYGFLPVNEYGQAVDALREAYKTWPQPYRELLEWSNTVFVPWSPDTHPSPLVRANEVLLTPNELANPERAMWKALVRNLRPLQGGEAAWAPLSKDLEQDTKGAEKNLSTESVMALLLSLSSPTDTQIPDLYREVRRDYEGYLLETHQNRIAAKTPAAPPQPKKNYIFTDTQTLVPNEIRKGDFSADLQRLYNAIDPNLDRHNEFGDAVFADATIEAAHASKRAGTSTNGQLTGPQAAFADILDLWEREQPEKLEALRAAKTRIESVLALKEQDGPQEWRQHQRLQKAIKESSGYIGLVVGAEAKVAAYKKVLKEYVIPADFAPNLALLRSEIEPIRTELNAWRDFDKRLGDSLFAKPVLQRAAWAAAPKEVKTIPSLGEASTTIADGLKELFRRTEQEHCPDVGERARNLALVGRLRDSTPLLLVAALGDDTQLRSLRTIYQGQATDRRQRLDELTDTVLVQAGMIPPREEVINTAPPPPPPEPPVPPTTTSDEVPEWDSIRQRVERFISRTLQANTDNPFTMFRCRLSTEPGHPLTLELSRWVNTGATRRAETRSERIAINRVNLDEALDIKKRVQAHVLNTPPIVPHRKLHNGRGMLTEHDPLPDILPRNEEDGTPGGLYQRGGLWSLRLTFDEPVPQGSQPVRTEVHIPLGIEQSGSRDEAEARRVMVVEHLQQLRTQNQQFIEAGQLDRVRRVTGQDIRIWLEQQIRTLNELSEAAQQAPANDAVLDTRIQTLATAWQHPIPDGIAPRDWLGQQIQHRGDHWQQARTIELDNYDFDREIPVNIPPSAGDQEDPRTVLLVQDPRLSGTPTPFWSANISIMRDGHLIGTRTINMQINAPGADGEAGGDPDLVVERLHTASRFMRDILQAYATANPGTDWYVTGEPSSLAQYSENELRNNIHIDKTRLDRIIDTLPYTGIINIETMIPESGLQPDEKGEVRFGLRFQREDGSPLRERREGNHALIPMERWFRMSSNGNPETDQTAINDFLQGQWNHPPTWRNASDPQARTNALADTFAADPGMPIGRTGGVQALLNKKLEETYSQFRDPTLEAQSAADNADVDLSPRQRVIRDIVATVRNGSLNGPDSVARHLRLKSPESYRGPLIVGHIDDVLRSTAFNAVAQAANIRQEIGQPAQGHGANGGGGGDNGDWQPGDPAHHHPPTEDQLEIARGFRRYAQRGTGEVTPRI